MHIKKSPIKSTRNSIDDDLSRKLLEAAIELKSKYRKIKAKLIKKIVNNVLQEYKKWVITKIRKRNLIT